MVTWGRSQAHQRARILRVLQEHGIKRMAHTRRDDEYNELYRTVGHVLAARSSVTYKAPPHRRRTRAALAILLDTARGAPHRAALDAVVRMGDTRKTAVWIGELGKPADVPKTQEQVDAERKAKLARIVAQRAKHAVKMLEKHRAILEREKKIVAKWLAKVKHYERSGVVYAATEAP